MVERPEAVPEGWAVRHRPAVIAAVAVPLVLMLILLAAGWLYDRELRPSTRQPVTPFPAPGLETSIHDGAQDPYRPRVKAVHDSQVTAAKRTVVQDGIAGWERQP